MAALVAGEQGGSGVTQAEVSTEQGPSSRPARRLDVQSLVPSIAISVSQIANAIALAALVFTGVVSEALERAVVLFVAGSVIASAIVALRSSFQVIVAGAKNNVTIVLAATTATVAAEVAAGTNDPSATVIVYFAIAVVACGASLWLVGRFGFGYLVRFVPHPVMSGFMAGTGLLLFRGGVGVATRRSVGLGDVPSLFTIDVLQYWLPAAALAILVVFGGPTSIRSMWIVVAVAVFHIAAAATGSIADAERDGWMLGPFPEAGGFSVLPGGIGGVDWGAVVRGLPGIVAVVLISLTALLLNSTSVAFETGDEIDLDRELRSAGAATIAAGVVGGTASFLSTGQTLLARRLNASSTLVAASTAVLGALTIIAGPSLIELMPRFVASAMIFAPAIILTRSWLLSSIRNASWSDRLVSTAIPIAMLTVGVIEGVGIGVIAAVLLFAWHYAAIDPLRLDTSVHALRSNVDRTNAERELLDEHGGRIAVFGLEGFLFFGSMARLGERLRTRVGTDGNTAAVVLDFTSVSGIDSSAINELQRLLDWCAGKQVTTHVAALGPASDTGPLTMGSVTSSSLDLDRALEEAEDHLLHAVTATPAASSVRARPSVATLLDELGTAVTERFDEFYVGEGTELVTAGTGNETLYVVLSGACNVLADNRVGAQRLRRITAGSFVGEISFFSGGDATARVVADRDTKLLRITKQDFDRLEATDPHVALRLVRAVLRHSNRQLAATTKLARDLGGRR